MDGMPYAYNKAILDHPDMKEFVEGVWMVGNRKTARIEQLEASIGAALRHAEKNGMREWPLFVAMKKVLLK